MNYKYDVAISYQSEIEEKAARIADYLEVEQLEVFFAPQRQQEILSEKLHEVLFDVYKNQSLVRLLLVSDSYLTSEWTQLEKRVSKGETSAELRRKIVVDYTEEKTLPEDLKMLVYIDGKKCYEDEIATQVVARVKELKDLTQKESEADTKNKEKDQNVVIHNNTGIITGDNAHFGDIHIGR